MGLLHCCYWQYKTGLTKQAFVDGRIITLSEVSFSSVYGGITTNITASGLTPYVVGKKYLVSLYVWSPVDFWWNQKSCPAAASNGHGAIWCKAGELTRVWYLATAFSTTTLDVGTTPATAPGTTNGGGLPLISTNNNWGGIMATGSAPYIGGFMVEPVNSNYLDGVAVIGDSTFAGSSGFNDRMYDFNVVANREITTVLGSELSLSLFNRAIGGQTLADMDTRWSTDITTLKPRCNAVIIQGGINDIGQGRTFAQMCASTQSMTAKAIADGFTYRYYTTITPFSVASTDAVKEALRKQYNTWLIATYGTQVADIATVVTDPATGKDLYGAIMGDGTHYVGAAKTAIAAYMAQYLDWSWRVKPSKYIKSPS
jgi:lysophospholipase L1-like esterase